MKLIAKPPTPETRITETTKIFLWSVKSTSCSIWNPLVAIKPYNTTHNPPITQVGIDSKSAINGPIKEIIIHINAATIILYIEAFLEIAEHDIDSPYVVFGHPPKNAPTNEPNPSPNNVRFNPGLSNKFLLITNDKCLWSAICSAKETKLTGTNEKKINIAYEKNSFVDENS